MMIELMKNLFKVGLLSLGIALLFYVPDFDVDGRVQALGRLLRGDGEGDDIQFLTIEKTIDISKPLPGVPKNPSISNNLDHKISKPLLEAPLEANLDNKISHPDLNLQAYPVVALRPDIDPDIQHKLETVKKMMQHAWNNYKQYAWGKNELRPISKRAHLRSIFGEGDLGATIVDALDTLYLMGLHNEFREGRNWIAEQLKVEKFNTLVSVYETNVRFVGGLLSCYALTGDAVFRDKAAEIADALLPAFETPTGLPYSQVQPTTGMTRLYHWMGNDIVLADVGSLHLEFTYLSDITGKNVYREKVDRIREVLNNTDRPDGLYHNCISPTTGKWGTRCGSSLGSLSDSFYEYLLKAWLVSGKTDSQARLMFDQAMQAALDKMLRVSPAGLSYLAEIKYGYVFEEKMEHLACFAGGMFALASTTLNNSLSDRYMDVARKLTETCHESYAQSETKLGPDAFRFNEQVEARAQKSVEKVYIQRPETFESYFIMWRLTKDQKYRDWGWDAVQAIEEHCRVDGGYTGVYNVYHQNPQGDDVQQSYFLAQTLKYLYLLFADDDLSLDEWVLNTGAHPLPVKGKNPLYRGKENTF